MSILKAMQDYLCEYREMRMQVVAISEGENGESEIRIISEINTDQTEENTGSYALSLSGNSLLEKDCLGNEKYQNSYVFYAKEASQNEIDRKENHEFLEDFSHWLENRNRQADFPDIGADYSVMEISVSNSMLLGTDSEGVSLYQIQIQLYYERKNDLWQ